MSGGRHFSGVDAMGDFLDSIGRVPLLSGEEEIQLARQFQAGQSLHQLKPHPEATLQEWAASAAVSTEELAHRLERSQRARNRMVAANLRLVVSVAKKYQHREMEMLDLISEGSLGLVRAVEKYDPSKGYKFSTYAYWWIREGIVRALNQKSRAVRLPTYVWETFRKVQRERHNILQTTGRPPSLEELAAVTELSPEKVRWVLKAVLTPTSLDAASGEETDRPLGECLECEFPSPEDVVEKHLLRDHIEALMSTLDPRKQQVIALRYGLNGDEPLTLSQIGCQLGLSRERIRQLENKAIAQMRLAATENREIA